MAYFSNPSIHDLDTGAPFDVDAFQVDDMYVAVLTLLADSNPTFKIFTGRMWTKEASIRVMADYFRGIAMKFDKMRLFGNEGLARVAGAGEQS